MAETAALVDSLHPLEVKVLAVLSGRSSQTSPPAPAVLRDDEIAWVIESVQSLRL